MRVRWTKLALADLEAIGDFIARDNAAAAQAVVRRIGSLVETLRDHPHLGRPGRIAGTRELVVADSPSIVPYRVRGGELQILAVLHGARRWPDEFSLTPRR